MAVQLIRQRTHVNTRHIGAHDKHAFATSLSPAIGFSADDLLSSLGLDVELPAPPSYGDGNGDDIDYYQSSAGYSLRLE